MCNTTAHLMSLVTHTPQCAAGSCPCLQLHTTTDSSSTLLTTAAGCADNVRARPHAGVCCATHQSRLQSCYCLQKGLACRH
jgi:hypothetical protein